MRIAILTATTLVMAGCATAPVAYPVEVTRYRVDDVGRGTITLAPAVAGNVDDVEYRAYADAVADALSRQGYTIVPDGGRAAYVAVIGIQSDRREVRSRAPFSIGLGGGTFSGGGGVGLGGGVTFPVGRGKSKDQVATTLSVKINRREGDLGVWEGRAQSQDVRPFGTPTSAAAATRIANALFTGFPGESGRSIEVK